MILSELGGTSASKTAEDVEVKKSKEPEADEEEEEEPGPDPEGTCKFDTDKHLVEKYRVSLDGCVYRGEGNANVVLALPNDHKVLRFRKSSPTSGASSPDGGRSRTRREIEFLEYVISCLLGGYVEAPKPLQINLEDMIKVSEAIRPLRPENRRRKEIVEDHATMFSDYAFLPEKLTTLLHNNSQDSCSGANLTAPTFCVEIKPKQGFRHEFDEQLEKCTFCLTQYYKLKTGAIHSLSSYCPYDLFSGDKDRMKKSIFGLIQSPQNNFKIFRDGVVVYDCTNEPKDIENFFAEWFSTGSPKTGEQNFKTFFELVSAALLREFSSQPSKEITANQKLISSLSFLDYDPQPRINQDVVSRAKKILYFSENECDFSGNELPPGSVLGKILHMQQLPYHSADLVYKVYSKHFASLSDEVVYSQMIRNYRRGNKVSVRNGEDTQRSRDHLGSSKAAVCSEDSFKLGKRISDSNGNKNQTIPYSDASVSSLDMENNNNRRMGDIGENGKGSITVAELQALQNYLLVTTAKDCSILMAFQEVDAKNAEYIPAEHIVKTTEGISFVVNIGVLDLDPKSIHCIEKHRLRDTNVLLSLVDMLEDGVNFESNELPAA